MFNKDTYCNFWMDFRWNLSGRNKLDFLYPIHTWHSNRMDLVHMRSLVDYSQFLDLPSNRLDICKLVDDLQLRTRPKYRTGMVNHIDRWHMLRSMNIRNLIGNLEVGYIQCMHFQWNHFDMCTQCHDLLAYNQRYHHTNRLCKGWYNVYSIDRIVYSVDNLRCIDKSVDSHELVEWNENWNFKSIQDKNSWNISIASIAKKVFIWNNSPGSQET